MMYAVIATSPFHDVSEAAGPFRTVARAYAAMDDLTAKGWNSEMVELRRVEDIDAVVNDEGMED